MEQFPTFNREVDIGISTLYSQQLVQSIVVLQYPSFQSPTLRRVASCIPILYALYLDGLHATSNNVIRELPAGLLRRMLGGMQPQFQLTRPLKPANRTHTTKCWPFAPQLSASSSPELPPLPLTISLPRPSPSSIESVFFSFSPLILTSSSVRTEETASPTAR